MKKVIGKPGQVSDICRLRLYESHLRGVSGKEYLINSNCTTDWIVLKML